MGLRHPFDRVPPGRIRVHFLPLFALALVIGSALLGSLQGRTLRDAFGSLALIGATLFFVLTARRRHAPAALLLTGAVDFVYGLVTSSLISLHLVAVIAIRLTSRVSTYDFRFYSLVLVGLVILTPALVCLLSATDLTRGELSVWKRALGATVILLIFNVPLMPLQDFAIALSAGAVLNIGLLVASRTRFQD